MTPGTPAHEPWAHDCCLACWDALGGQGAYPIACVHCTSLRCPHASNHNNECSTKAEYRHSLPTPRTAPPSRRFNAGLLLRRP